MPFSLKGTLFGIGLLIFIASCGDLPRPFSYDKNKESNPLLVLQDTKKSQQEPVGEPESKPSKSLEGKIVYYLIEVSGLSDENSRLLSRNLKYLLNKKYNLVNSFGAKAKFIISGQAEVRDLQPNKKELKVTWDIFERGGRFLGKVSQKNQIAGEQLGAGWPHLSFLISEGAASGINNLVQNFAR